MTGYRIGILPRGTKFLRTLTKDARDRIGEKIDSLSADPRPHGCEKLRDFAPETWRVRVGDYRILYVIDDGEHRLLVYDIDRRDSVYR